MKPVYKPKANCHLMKIWKKIPKQLLKKKKKNPSSQSYFCLSACIVIFWSSLWGSIEYLCDQHSTKHGLSH